MQADERIGGDLQVQVGALGRDEIPQRVIEIESHTSSVIGRRPPALESPWVFTPWSAAGAGARAPAAIAPRASSAAFSVRAAAATRSAPSASDQLGVERRPVRAAGLEHGAARVGQRHAPHAAVGGVAPALDVAERLELAHGLRHRLGGHAEVLGDLADRPRPLDQLLDQEAVGVADVRVLGRQALEDLGVEDLAQQLGPEHEIVVM